MIKSIDNSVLCVPEFHSTPQVQENLDKTNGVYICF